MIEPEKEIVLTIAESSIENDIRNSIIKAINLNEPGMGIGFVVSLDKVFGICHPFYEMKCSDG
jgi:nitrogen regulatory protein P-II 1